MLLPHALTLAQARSYVAALADQACTIDASSAYEHVLLEIDRLHDDECPAIDSTGIPEERQILLAVASDAIEDLQTYGIEALSIELVLAMLDEASALDRT